MSNKTLGIIVLVALAALDYAALAISRPASSPTSSLNGLPWC